MEEQLLLRVPPEVGDQIRQMIKSKRRKNISVTMDGLWLRHFLRLCTTAATYSFDIVLQREKTLAAVV